MRMVSVNYLGVEFGMAIKNKRRGNIRDCAKEIGISGATLSRIENGGTPDLKTFIAICGWGNFIPYQFLKVRKSKIKK